jgi:hypothetical protein
MKSVVRERKRLHRLKTDLRLTPEERVQIFATHSRHMVRLSNIRSGEHAQAREVRLAK